MRSLKVSILVFFAFVLCSNISEGQSNHNKSNWRCLIEVDKAGFPGGTIAWNDFLRNNLNSNVPVEKGCPPGKYQILTKFIINKEGYIDSIIPETRYGFGMEEEVIRVIKLSPKWEPAKRNGRPVKAYRIQPLTFVVEPETEEKKNQN